MLEDMDHHDFGSAELCASVKADGAELCQLRDAAGVDYLWPASPPWPRHAPVLFPIVGRLRDDTLTHHGQTYRMTQHGFARDRRFTWIERSSTGCRLVLSDDSQTRAMYPFGFRFELAYTVRGATLETRFTIVNTGEEVLPASMGAHPAFRWPLIAGMPKDAYALTFEANETAPLGVLDKGLLSNTVRPSPVHQRRLGLTEALFDQDALIFLQPASRSVRFASATGPALTVSWQGFDQLGVWSRPDGDFLCIEPWLGVASPERFAGEFRQKPYLCLIEPGGNRSAVYAITVS